MKKNLFIAIVVFVFTMVVSLIISDVVNQKHEVNQNYTLKIK